MNVEYPSMGDGTLPVPQEFISSNNYTTPASNIKYVKSTTGRPATPPNVPWETYEAGDYGHFAANLWVVGAIYCQLTLLEVQIPNMFQLCKH
jgi:hypothetical protein